MSFTFNKLWLLVNFQRTNDESPELENQLGFSNRIELHQAVVRFCLRQCSNFLRHIVNVKTFVSILVVFKSDAVGA
jgi:hypothetical protein